MLLNCWQSTRAPRRRRAIRFDLEGRPLQAAQQEFAQHYPRPGWVEHDAEEIWATTLATTREAMTDDVKAIGITNQRETVVLVGPRYRSAGA